MNALHQLLEAISALGRQARIGISAYIAERSVAVYEFSPYREEGCDVLRNAVSLVWDAASGVPVPAELVTATVEEVSSVVPASEQQEPASSASILAGVTVLSALDSLKDASSQPPFRACLHQLSAFESVGDEESVLLEEKLQHNAIKLLAMHRGPVSRSLFKDFPLPLVDRFM